MKTFVLTKTEIKKLGDKQEQFYELQAAADSIQPLKEAASKLAEGSADVEHIRKQLGIMPGVNQIDAIGFVKKLLKH